MGRTILSPACRRVQILYAAYLIIKHIAQRTVYFHHAEPACAGTAIYRTKQVQAVVVFPNFACPSVRIISCLVYQIVAVVVALIRAFQNLGVIRIFVVFGFHLIAYPIISVFVLLALHTGICSSRACLQRNQAIIGIPSICPASV